MHQPVAGNTEYTQPSNLTFYPALDGLRAIAFLLVLLIHYYKLPWGFAGVNFFFVLSGFLITGILFDTRDRPDRARRFYLRRALRIFPLYYGVIVMVVLLQPWLRWNLSWPWIAWPAYLGNFLRLWGGGVRDPLIRSVAYAQLHSATYPKVVFYFGHFWSLCVEEQFYLLWPWVVFATRSKRALMGICLTVVAVSPLLRSVVANHTPTWMNNMELTSVVGVPFQLDALLLGALLALLWRGQNRELLQQVAQWTLGILSFCALGYAVHIYRIYPHGHLRDLYQYPDWRATWDLSLLNVYGAALMICALKPGSLTYRLLNGRALRYLGRISYGAYVFHDIPHMTYERWVLAWQQRAHFSQGVAQKITVLVALTMTIILAGLSYRFIELPILSLKERWAPAKEYEAGSTVSR